MSSYTKKYCKKSKAHFAVEQQVLIALLFNKNKKENSGRQYNLKYLQTLAKMNGVLFPLLAQLKKSVKNYNELELIEMEYKSQNDLAIRMARIAHELITLFAAHGLHLIPMKTFLQFPYVDDDLDVITVNKDRIKIYRQLLEQHGYDYFKSRSSLREPEKRFYIPKGGDIKKFRVHLHFAASWNGVEFLDIKTIWKRKRFLHAHGYLLPIPSIEDEILIMAAHAVHENRYILLGELIQLKKLVQHSDINWDYIVQTAKYNNWLPAFFYFCSLTNMIMENLGHGLLVPSELINKLSNESIFMRFLSKQLHRWDGFDCGVCFPFIMPFGLTSLVFLYKFIKDLTRKTPKTLFRELLAFTIVDWAVLYRFKQDIDKLLELKAYV